LGLIASKITTSKSQIVDFLTHSFYYHQILSGSFHFQKNKSNQKSKIVSGKKLLKQHQERMKRLRKKGRGTDPLGMVDENQNLFQTADQIYKQQIHKKSKNPKNKFHRVNKTDSHEKREIIEHQINRMTRYFIQYDLIEKDREESHKFNITAFGKITTRTYLPPQDAVLLRGELQHAEKIIEKQELNLNAVTWLHLITKINSFRKFYLKKRDYPKIISFRDEQHDSLLMNQIWQPQDQEFPEFGKQLKLTMILRDWINEVHEREITENFEIGPGDLYRVINNAQWIMRSLFQISQLEAPSKWQRQIERLLIRIKHGIKPSAIPLVKIKGIGRVRARNLIRSGFNTLTKLRKSTVDELAQIPLIGKSLAHSIFSQLNMSEDANKSIMTKKKDLSIKTKPRLNLKKKKTSSERANEKEINRRNQCTKIQQIENQNIKDNKLESHKKDIQKKQQSLDDFF
jgi:replicative superfamily II helicase